MSRVIVIGGYTKLLAVPGVRFGYAVAGKKTLEKIRGNLPEWNLSVFAQEAAMAGSRVLQKGTYLAESRKLIEIEREYLCHELRGMEIRCFDSSTVFVLVKTPFLLQESLLRRGILIRDCENFAGLGKGYYRIAVKDHKANDALVGALKEKRQKGVIIW